MGLLQEITVRYAVDLSDLQTGTAQAKDLISGVGSTTLTTSSEMSDAFSSVTEALSSFAEMLQSSAEDASTALTTVGESASTANDSLISLSDEADMTASSLTDLGAEADSAGSQIAEATNFDLSGISGMGGGLLDLTSKIGQTVMGFQNMSNIAEQAASSLFGPAMTIEEATNSFDVFDGSMKKAQQEMSDLSSFAARTPFETSAIDDAALKMQSVGISANNVIPYIHSLGDALDATGRVSSADLNMIVDDFDKIQTQGHLTTDVMNSFALQGIDAWSVLEKQTGKTHDQLAQLISKGLYPAKDAMRDLTAGIEANPLYTGQMANDTNSMTGIMSTLKSNWDQALASFASPVMKDLEPILNGISNDLSSPGFKDFAAGVGQQVANAFNTISDAAQSIPFGQIAQGAQAVGTWFSTSVVPAIQQAEPGFQALGNTIGQLASSYLPPLISGAGKILPPLITLSGLLAGGIANGIRTIVSIGSGLVNFFKNNQVAMDGLLAVLGAVGIGVLAFAITQIPALVVGFGAWAVGAGTAALATLAAAAPFIVVGAIAGAIIFGIVEAVQHWSQIMLALQVAAGVVTSAVGGFFSGVGSTIHGVVSGVGNAFSGLGTLTSNIWNGMWNDVKGGINAIIGGINDFIGFIDGIQIHIPSIGVGPFSSPAFDWDGLGIPKIPTLATGGQVSAGWFLAGEEGPEIINTDGGATVYNRSQTAAMLANSGGSGGETHIHIYLDSQEIAHYTADETGKIIVKELFGHGPVRRAA